MNYGKWKVGQKENVFSNEDQFFNSLDQRDEKYSIYFQWGIKRLKKFFEID